jgi:opacity protein-like surface antigen
MSKMMLAVLTLAVAIAIPAVAQDTTQPSTQANPNMSQPTDQSSTRPMQQPDSSQASQSQSNQAGNSASSASGTGTDTQAGQTLTGTISADGKSFNSNGTTYTISNPNSVKPYANQPITVGYEMDNNNSIRITKVMLTKPQNQ